MKKFLSTFFLLSSLCGCQSDTIHDESVHNELIHSKAESTLRVSALDIRLQNLPVRSEIAGRTRAFRSAEIRPQVGGLIEKRFFREGSRVNKGELLYEINADSYRAEVAIADGERNVAAATLFNAETHLARLRKLAESQGIALHEVDLAEASFQQASAQLAAADAALEKAEIDLERTQIRAPIGGVIGRSAVTEGALVSPAQIDALAVIQQFDPIYVDMVQSSQQFLQLKRRLQAGTLHAGDGQVQLLLADGLPYAHDGDIQFTEMQVEPSSGAVTLRAKFPNPDNLLLPGMYVRAQVNQGIEPKVALVPQQAVIYSAAGNASVWLADSDNKATRRPVTIVAREGHHWAIAGVLASGERVIVEGLQRVQEGQQLTVTPWQATNALEISAR
ncbi:efflux RND transporter periplasmic adaptor subunit [Teredinibacter turnerae]|uniref:efflux RND transporter periplasmic adaptor subunit n=1 Tax=Teredinibacter turnerae TaxID=2426 RepID=UPI00040891D0|nr:efflux RND transporter periplasmic adaptor subunit [Teredinibacter turnerae]